MFTSCKKQNAASARSLHIDLFNVLNTFKTSLFCCSIFNANELKSTPKHVPIVGERTSTKLASQ